MRGRWAQIDRSETSPATSPAPSRAFGRAALIPRSPSISSNANALVVGNAVYHSVGDREEALRALSFAYDQAYIDIGHQVGVLPDEGSAARVEALGKPHWYTWWETAAKPLFAAWIAFRRTQLTDDVLTGPMPGWAGYAERWETDWSVYEQWRARLVQLRADAQNLGLHLISPPPAKFATTLPEDVKNLANQAKDAAAGAAKDALTLTKIAIGGAIALGGAIVIMSLANAAKNNRDPIEHYAGMWKNR